MNTALKQRTLMSHWLKSSLWTKRDHLQRLNMNAQEFVDLYKEALWSPVGRQYPVELSQHHSTLRKSKKRWEEDDKRGQRKTEVVDSMCINLLIITPHEEDASFSLKEQSEKWSSAPYYSSLSVKSTIHSWDAPPSPNAQMLPPVSCWWGKLQLRHSKAFKGS